MLNFVVNANSGKGRGLKNLNKIIHHCYNKKVPYTIHVTGSQGHATTIANTLAKMGAETIIAVGGDGTFHEVINGVAEFENVTVGFIPSGRGNDFARAAKLHLDPVKALNDIIRGETTPIDIFKVGDKYCLNIAGTGLDTEVLKSVDKQSGKITYLVALLKAIKNFTPYKITVITNGTETKYECIMVGVCNGMYIGGGMKVSPLSKINDEKLDIMVIEVPSDGKIMKALGGFLKGTHINKPYVKHILCDEVKIESDAPSVQIDGEIYDGLPFDCKILKGGLKTFKTTGK